MKNEFIKRIISSIILLPIVYYVIIKGSYFFNCLILICISIISYEWHMMSKNKIYYYFGFIFLFFSILTIYSLRNNFEGGAGYFLLILLICIFTDIGGYIFGKLFKGPKLTKLSPNKTYSGVLGGYLLPIIFITFLFYKTDFFFLDKINELNIFLLIFFVSSISQIGDLLISYFKRLSKIKDTGKIIPGHGGLLDRVDGMIFAFPFSYIYLLFNIS